VLPPEITHGENVRVWWVGKILQRGASLGSLSASSSYKCRLRLKTPVPESSAATLRFSNPGGIGITSREKLLSSRPTPPEWGLPLLQQFKTAINQTEIEPKPVTCVGFNRAPEAIRFPGRSPE